MPVAVTLQRQSSGGICNYKDFYKTQSSKELFYNDFGQVGNVHLKYLCVDATGAQILGDADHDKNSGTLSVSVMRLA